MSSEQQEISESSDFLSFNSNRNSDDGQNVRNNFQYRPYNRNHNHRNHNFRRDHFAGGPRNDGHAGFAPADFSSPVGGYQQRFDRGFRGGRPNHMNQYHNQRNFNQFKKFGGHNHRGGGGGGGGGHNFKDAPIEQYFHQSMLEDPWAQCQKFNGTALPDSALEPPSSENDAVEIATES